MDCGGSIERWVWSGSVIRKIVMEGAKALWPDGYPRSGQA